MDSGGVRSSQTLKNVSPGPRVIMRARYIDDGWADNRYHYTKDRIL